MVQYKDIEMNGMTTPSTSKIAEPTPISERPFISSNESAEFSSFYDANQVSTWLLDCFQKNINEVKSFPKFLSILFSFWKTALNE